jgi:hypothetical protein
MGMGSISLRHQLSPPPPASPLGMPGPPQGYQRSTRATSSGWNHLAVAQDLPDAVMRHEARSRQRSPAAWPTTMPGIGGAATVREFRGPYAAQTGGHLRSSRDLERPS